MAEKQPERAKRIRQDVSAEHDSYTAGQDQIFNFTPAKEKLAPGLLPRDVPGFTGRAGELERVIALAGDGSAVVTAIGGAAGVGKTALAVHAAHQLLPRFPGGHLYADLRGYTEGQASADPGEVLDVFLRRLGVAPGEVPAGMEEQSGLLRQLLADQPVLMVLDNAATEAQVRPLLPGAGCSLVLITSRSALAGLDLDDRISVDVLSEAEATALLVELVGQDRAAAEPEAIAEVAQWCGCLPLALRIAGQLLAAHPMWSVSRLAGMLADERHRLDHLAAGDRQVRAAFEVSYRQLTGSDARMFRFLGLHPGPDFDARAAAALAGLDPGSAARILDRLVLANLVIEDAGERFRMHDLLRLFARQTCETEDDSTVRAQATIRLVDHFERLAAFLDACMSSQFRPRLAKVLSQAEAELPTFRQAFGLFEADLRNMLVAAALAAELKQHERVWNLSESLLETLRLLNHLDDLVTVCGAALNAARAVGEIAAEKRALINLGVAYRGLHLYDDAITSYRNALEICREIGDRKSEGQAFNNLGVAYISMEWYDDAITSYRNALEICREIGDRQGEGQALNNLGNTYTRTGQYDDAITSYRNALEICREVGDRQHEGLVLNNLGSAYTRTGQYDDAITIYRNTLEICQEVGDRQGEGLALYNLGNIYTDMQCYDDAITSYHRAIEALRESNDSEGAESAELRLELALSKVHQRGRRRWWRRRARDPREQSDSATG